MRELYHEFVICLTTIALRYRHKRLQHAPTPHRHIQKLVVTVIWQHNIGTDAPVEEMLGHGGEALPICDCFVFFVSHVEPIDDDRELVFTFRRCKQRDVCVCLYTCILCVGAHQQEVVSTTRCKFLCKYAPVQICTSSSSAGANSEMYTLVYVCMYRYECMYKYEYMYTYIYIYVCMYICMYSCIHINKRQYIFAHTCIYIYTYLYVFIYTYTYVYVHKYGYTYMNVCQQGVYSCTYMYMFLPRRRT